MSSTQSPPAPSSSSPSVLARGLTPVQIGLWAVGATLYGALAAWGLQDEPLPRWADRTLILAALGALPAPIVLLSRLTTPAHAATRRFLGQSGAAIFADAVAASWRQVGLLALVPAGFWAAASLLQLDALATLQATAVLTCGVMGAALGAMALLAAAMDTISRGTQGVWRAAAGAGFGPPEIAPLLYAPALAFLAGLVPAGLMVAVWNAAPQLLNGERAALGTLVVVAIAARAAKVSCSRLPPRAHRALMVINQAHNTPFALAEEAPQPPAWLAATTGPMIGTTTGTISPAEATARLFLSRAWVRRYPASLFASVLIAVAAGLAVDHNSAPIAIAALCGAATLYGGTRNLGLLRGGPELQAASQWLGAQPGVMVSAERQLGLRLTLPALSVAVVGWLSWAWLPTLLGVLLGAALAAALNRLKRREIGLWAGRLSLAVALILAAGLG